MRRIRAVKVVTLTGAVAAATLVAVPQAMGAGVTRQLNRYRAGADLRSYTCSKRRSWYEDGPTRQPTL
jgi:hypothetical protein